MTKPTLIAYGRDVRTPFGLLGTNENALTFALGYTFQNCPELLRMFLRDVGITNVRSGNLRNAEIHLQRMSSAAKHRDITDIEIVIPGSAFVIVEAKIGLTEPTPEQCLRYLQRFRKHQLVHSKLIALVESSSTEFIEQYARRHPKLGAVLVAYQWVALIPHSLRLQKLYGDTEPGRCIRAFRTFLEEEYAMKSFTGEVWVVPTSDSKQYELHVKNRVYWQSGNWRHAMRPLYIAFRSEGKVRAIQRVRRVEHGVSPNDYLPEEASYTLPKPTETYTIWHLEEPVDLPNPIQPETNT